MTAREIDIHTLPSMLTALRLPTFHKLWTEIAARADDAIAQASAVASLEKVS